MNDAQLLPELHMIALKRLLDLELPEQIHWALTGSAGLRLQGVEVPIHDLDIQSDRAGVDEIVSQILTEVIEAPMIKESPRMRSYFGVALIAGVKVELMGDIQHRLPDGNCEAPIDVLTYLRWVDWEGRRVPVLDLNYEAQAYARMGRSDKTSAIINALTSIGESKDG